MDDDREALDLLRLRVRRFNALASGTVAGVIAGGGLFLATNWLVLKGGEPVGPHLALLGQFFTGYRCRLRRKPPRPRLRLLRGLRQRVRRRLAVQRDRRPPAVAPVGAESGALMVTTADASALAGAPDPGGYDPVAETFARLSQRFTVTVAERLVSIGAPQPGERVLDVGTGSGVVARAAAARVGPSGSVLGVDVSEEMLETARKETASAGFPQVDFRRQDVQHLALGDASFDVVCSLFALPHVADPAAALREMHRVLRPSGRLVLGMGSRPPLLHRALWRRQAVRLQAWRGYALVAPGLVARHLAREGLRLAHAPGLAAPSLRRLLVQVGFRDIRTSWVGGEAPLDSASELWDVETTFSTPVRRWRATAAPAEVERRRASLIEDADRVLARGGRLVYFFGATILEARRARA